MAGLRLFLAVFTSFLLYKLECMLYYHAKMPLGPWEQPGIMANDAQEACTA
jgi:hypothetical protein